MPLIEITVERETLNKEQQLRMAKAVQKTMLEEYEAMKGKTTGSYVIVREVSSETWLATRPNT
jgi:phenylpyruvate tautomerase PptA (4-oxalocrotonate tautomerase family)